MRIGSPTTTAIATATVLMLAATTAHAGATKVQKAKVKEAMELYTSPISVPHDASDYAFDRASEWMSVIPDQRIDVATNTTLQTLRASEEDGGSSMDLICSVKRRRTTNDVEFSANCRIDNPFAIGEGNRNEAMLRRYIMTGDAACLADGGRWTDAALCLLECSKDGNTCEPLPVESVYPEMAVAEQLVVGSCTLDQIISMVQSGLAKDQVMAACGGG